MPSNDSPLPGTISSGLLKRVKAGTPEAWSRMADIYVPLVLYWCNRVGVYSHDAEDIAQNVFSTVASRIEEFSRSKSKGAFRGWLRTITRHKLGDYFRAKARDGKVQELARDLALLSSGKWESVESLNQEAEVLAGRICELIQTDFSEASWVAFRRTAIDGVPAKDVAEEIGITVNAVYLARSRILRRIREKLGDDVLD